MTVVKKMVFSGLTAWFSSSVNEANRQDWLSYGGTEVGLEHAQYIFSQDANSPDTKSIYKSPAYLDEHLSVFHPQFIKKCLEKGSIEEVELGLYILPPTEIQDVVHQEVGIPFIWEERCNITKGADNTCSGVQDKVLPHSGQEGKTDCATAEVEETLRLEAMAKVMDKLDDFTVGKPGYNIWTK